MPTNSSKVPSCSKTISSASEYAFKTATKKNVGVLMTHHAITIARVRIKLANKHTTTRSVVVRLLYECAFLVTLMTHRFRFFSSTTLMGLGTPNDTPYTRVGAPHKCPLKVALCSGIYADVRLQIPMTHSNAGTHHCSKTAGFAVLPRLGAKSKVAHSASRTYNRYTRIAHTRAPPQKKRIPELRTSAEENKKRE